EGDSELFTALVGAMTVLVALRAPFSDPLGAWWSIGALLAISALGASLNWFTLRRGYLYAAGILFNLSVSIWLIKYQSQQISSLSAFVEANVIALSLAGVLWLCLELRARRIEPKSNSAASLHTFAALWSLLAMGGVVATRVFTDLFEFHPPPLPWLDWFELGSLTALMFACLWDREAAYAVAGIYLLGLLTAGTLVHHLRLTPEQPEQYVWALIIAGAIQALA